MTNLDTQVKEFVQEVLKINGLIAMEEISSIASHVLAEKNSIFHVSEDRKKELNDLLKELNQELTAARENHEALSQKADGFQALIKPFSNVFNYISANTHEKRAQELATEAAKFFLKEEATHFIRKTLRENADKIKSSDLSMPRNISNMKDNLSKIKDKVVSKANSSNVKDSLSKVKTKLVSKAKSLSDNDNEDEDEDNKSSKSTHKTGSTKNHHSKKKIA